MRKRVADAGQITPSKAKGVIGLMALMLIYQIGVFVVEKCSSKESKESLPNSEGQATALLFEFNPNTIPIDSLQMLGFSQKQAATVIHYRDKGGKFLKKRDFAKLYVVDEAKYLLLEPYIKLPDSVAGEKVQATKRRGFTKRERAKPSAKTKEHSVRENSTKGYSTTNNFTREYSKTQNSKTGYSTKEYLTRDDFKTENSTTGNYRRESHKAGNTTKYNTTSIDLNEADSVALMAVKGIGPYFCREILKLREKLGSFAHTEQLLEIRGMDEEKFNRIRGQIFVHPAGIKKFSLKNAKQEFLKQHPYIGAYNARGIRLFIQTEGEESCTLSNLVKNNILTAEAAEKLRPYIIEE